VRVVRCVACVLFSVLAIAFDLAQSRICSAHESAPEGAKRRLYGVKKPGWCGFKKSDTKFRTISCHHNIALCQNDQLRSL